MKTKKLQISLEFMLVFAFVITIFLILFAVIAARTSLLFNQQVFAQTQFVAQEIAQQLTTAVNSGNGYSSNILLQAGYGINPYAVNVLSNGEVIVTAKQGVQKIQSIAFSQAKDVMASNSMETGNLSVQNFLGLICVDVSCPNQTAYPVQSRISTQNVHVAQFNGKSSYINIPSSSSLNFGGSAFTVAAWVYLNTVKTGANTASAVFAQRSACGAQNLQLYAQENYTAHGAPAVDFVNSVSTTYNLLGNKVLSAGRWYQIAGVYNGSILTLYIDGTADVSIPANGSVQAASVPSVIGYDTCGANNYFPGDISNVQLYNTALSPNQIWQLYNESISGEPVVSGSVIGWWPLNGNANDYSGNGNDGTANNLLYSSVSQVYATLTNRYGAPVGNALVGFASNLGKFLTNESTINYTDSDGTATVLLNQNLSSGPASIDVAAYPGSASEASNLVGWWPLSAGFLSKSYYNLVSWWPLNGTAYDYGGLNAGTASNVTYVRDPNKSVTAAQFNGQNGDINTGTSNFPAGSAARSAFAWVYPTKSPSDQNEVLSYGTNANNYECSGMYILSNVLNFQVCGSDAASTLSVPDNQWSFVGYSYAAGASAVTVYVDGASQTLTLGSALDTIVSSSYLGNQPSPAPSPTFKGSISNVQLYNTPLTAAQAKQLYEEGIGGAPLYSATTAYSLTPDNSLIGQPTNVIYSSQGAIFNGNNSYISTGTSGLPTGSSSRSIFAWVYFTGNSASLNSAYYYGSPVSGGFEDSELGVWNGRAVVDSEGGYVTDGPAVSSNAWHLIGYTYSSGASQITIYVDGNSLTGSIYGNSTLNTVIGSSVIGGTGPGFGSYPFQGSIANVQIYNTSLTQAQVWQLYAYGRPGYPNTTIPLSFGTG